MFAAVVYIRNRPHREFGETRFEAAEKLNKRFPKKTTIQTAVAGKLYDGTWRDLGSDIRWVAKSLRTGEWMNV